MGKMWIEILVPYKVPFGSECGNFSSPWVCPNLIFEDEKGTTARCGLNLGGIMRTTEGVFIKALKCKALYSKET